MMRKIFTLILMLVLLIHTGITAFAIDYDTQVEIRLMEGHSYMIVNGEPVLCEAPFMEDGYLYAPLRLILEAFGAEVNWLPDGKIGIIYRNLNVEVKQGAAKILVNRNEREMVAPAKTKGVSTMVPVDFFKDHFNTLISVDPSTHETVIFLPDDGALTDLSFLTGGIVKSKVGHSYFKWSINVPKGSTVEYKSFHSRNVILYNEQKEFFLEVDVEVENAKSLAELLREKKKEAEFSSYKLLLDSRIKGTGSNQYIELLYMDTLMEEASVHRIYTKDDYVYHLILTSLKELNPEKLLKNKSILSLLNSFRRDYDGTDRNVQDISVVEGGVVKYENIVTVGDKARFATWEISIPAEWDWISNGYADLPDETYMTRLGSGNKKYIDVQMRLWTEESLRDYAKSMVSFYEREYNPSCYYLDDLIEDGAGNDTFYRLLYRVKLGSANYRCEDRFIVKGGILYTITVKCPEENHEEEEEVFKTALDSMKFYNTEQPVLLSALKEAEEEKYMRRMEPTDDLISYHNEEYLWSIEIPGFWEQEADYGSSLEIFYNHRSKAYIMVEALENTPENEELSDEEKFPLSILPNEEVKLQKIISDDQEALPVNTYKGRYENKEDELYLDVTVRVVTGDQYFYCYTSIIQDLYASDENLLELEKIWESFTVDVLPEEGI